MVGEHNAALMSQIALDGTTVAAWIMSGVPCVGFPTGVMEGL